MSTQSPSTPFVPPRFGRRAVVTGSGAVAVAGLATLAEITVSPASAAPPNAAWKLGGNSGVNTDGSNFLGPNNVAPLTPDRR